MNTLHAVNNRILFFPQKFNLKIPLGQIKELLANKGIETVETDPAFLAHSLALKGKWKWAARQWEAPHVFDCTSFTKWIWGKSGLWLPRRPRQQFSFFLENGWINAFNGEGSLEPGDLLFATSPYVNGKLNWENSSQELRHMLISLGGKTLVHATNSDLGCGVILTNLDEFLEKRKILAVGKVPEGIALSFQPQREIETDDDIFWILKSLNIC